MDPVNTFGHGNLQSSSPRTDIFKDSEGKVGSGPALERKACSQVRFGTALGDRTDGPAAPGTAVRDAFDGQDGSGMAVLGALERQVREKGNLAKSIVLPRKNNDF